METQKAIMASELRRLIDLEEEPRDKAIAQILARFHPNWSFVRKTKYCRYWESVKWLQAYPDFDELSPTVVMPPLEELEEVDVLIAELALGRASIFYEVPQTHWKPGKVVLNETAWKLRDVGFKFIFPEVISKSRNRYWDNYAWSLKNRFKRVADQSRPDGIKDDNWAYFERWTRGEGYERLARERSVTPTTVRSLIVRILTKLERREKNAKMVQV